MITDSEVAGAPGFPSFGDPKWISKATGPGPDACDRADQAKSLRIIVIDDESLIAETVTEILNEEGFEATAVANGAAAIELSKTFRPDLVLSDVIMPGLNGIETGVRIREVVPTCNIILFSGQAETLDLLARARQQGHYFEILAKPIKPEQLISVIRKSSGSL